MNLLLNRKRKSYNERILPYEDDEDEYLRQYRFNKETVNSLEAIFIGYNTKTRGGALSPETKMQIYL